MSREDAPPPADAVQATQNLQEAIPNIAFEIARLDPGPAAALRRGPYRGSGAAAFWMLLTKHNPIGIAHNEVGWAALIQAIAVLTPKGRDPDKQSAHDYSMPMGRALCEAGFSELRLARLLSGAPELRPEVAVRTCRRLAGREFNRFNLVTLGDFVLFGGDHTDRRIARDYYRAHAAAARESQDKQDRETSTDA